MSLISAIVTTQNRPALLDEALLSLINQSLPPSEIIVVDDGSHPRVNAETLTSKFGNTVRVVRNEEARGLAFSRNRGVEAATSEFIVHLDDDDLLSPQAIDHACALLSSDPELDLVFLGAQGFGARSEHFNRVQPEAVARVITSGMGREDPQDIVSFDKWLIVALLLTVPIAFQRVVLRRETWSQISALRWRAYQIEPDVPDDEAAKLRIIGPLRDSEWAIYAAAICGKTALINRPLYLQRCEGQGYSSQPANIEQHMLQGLAIKNQLFRASLSLPEFGKWKKQIRDSIASAYFDTAYYYFRHGKRGTSLRYLRQALFISQKPAYIRFAFRMWLPRRRAHIE
ncbi:glycosyltransferase family A protein [Methylocaldum sp.]|uniref:glycosyltransferase family 2 protein n=1 Tax=Methylocaldum sp. TaxID=1969727 RepID=UPI002D5D2E9C|nr:glycosyltransferase family A protein [Methylocaldum sp.]HYE37067.1 glycosyltransferase family A protein [Methylocaldum sp.]